MTKRLFFLNQLRKVKYWVIIPCLAVVIVMSITGNNVTEASVSHTAPSNSKLLFAMEWSRTTTTDLVKVPIYLKQAPPAAGVNVIISEVRAGTYRERDLRLYIPGTGDVWPGHNGSIHIPAGNFRWDNRSGTYKNTVRIHMTGKTGLSNSNWIHFRLNVDLSNGLSPASAYIGYGGYGTQYNTGSIHYGSSGVDNYSIKMATPCDVEGRVRGYVELMDLDSGNKDNGDRQITVNIVNETTGATNVYVGPEWTDWEDQSGSNPWGQKGTLSLPVDFYPDHKYRIDLKNIAHSNILMFKLPFDNISYAVSCYEYQLNPSTSINPPAQTVPIGGAVSGVTSLIENTIRTKSRRASSATAKFLVKRGDYQRLKQNYQTKFHFESDGSTWPCVAVSKATNALAKNCVSDPANNETKIFGPKEKFYKNIRDSEGFDAFSGAELGDYICFATMVNFWHHDEGGADWHIGQPACVMIVKSPKVQALGGDVIAGGELTSSLVRARGKNYTNFGEFATFTSHKVGDFRSMGDPSVGTGDYGLTFANNTATTKGCFFNASCLKNNSLAENIKDSTILNHASVFAKDANFPINTTQSKILGSAGAGGTVYKFNIIKKLGGNIGDLGKIKEPTIIVSNRELIINENIEYDLPNPLSPVSNATKLPQLIILAPSIRIDSNVEKIHAWLVAQPNLTTAPAASGLVDTCRGYHAGNLSSDACNKQLEIKGLVLAKNIHLKRTYGSRSIDDQNLPAEIFNLTPETYAFLMNYSTFSNHSIQTTYVDEVPPRY